MATEPVCGGSVSATVRWRKEQENSRNGRSEDIQLLLSVSPKTSISSYSVVQRLSLVSGSTEKGKGSGPRGNTPLGEHEVRVFHRRVAPLTDRYTYLRSQSVHAGTAGCLVS